MRKAVLSVAVLGLALMLSGCRDITPDLHDIHTVKFDAGLYGAVDGEWVVILETDVLGRITRLPVAQSGTWEFVCNRKGPYGRRGRLLPRFA